MKKQVKNIDAVINQDGEFWAKVKRDLNRVAIQSCLSQVTSSTFLGQAIIGSLRRDSFETTVGYIKDFAADNRGIVLAELGEKLLNTIENY